MRIDRGKGVVGAKNLISMRKTGHRLLLFWRLQSSMTQLFINCHANQCKVVAVKMLLRRNQQYGRQCDSAEKFCSQVIMLNLKKLPINILIIFL